MPDTEQDRVCVGTEEEEGQLEDQKAGAALKQHTVYAGGQTHK